MGNFAENLNLGNRFRPPPLQNLNFLHLFVALLQETHFPKGIKQKPFSNEMKAIFCKKSRRRDLIHHSSLSSNVNALKSCITCKG